MSFFDEDAPTRRRTPPRPRRSAPAGGSAGGDQQTLMVRRATAIGIFVVFAILLLFLINSCRSSASENALKDYNRDVTEIAEASESQVGRPFFELVGGRGADGAPADLQTAVSSLRVEAENHLEQAEDLNVPDAMVPAQRSLLIALELRRDGLDFVARRVRAALGDEGDAAEEATAAIAGQMQAFLASDVLYAGRVRPLIAQAFDKEEIGGQEVARSTFVNDIAWLSPRTVAQRLGGGGGGDTAGGDDEDIAPGLHGMGLTSVAVGETTLNQDGANRIASAGPPTFTVQFANQGENDEQDVRVDVSVSGGGGRAITGSDTVETIARGATGTASVRLPRLPPAGAALTIKVRVRPVPGEKKTDNNELEYSALFEAG